MTDESALTEQNELTRLNRDLRVRRSIARRTPMTGRAHDLKTWPAPFEGVKLGIKTLELRFNDRNYQPGDLLVLREWDPVTGEYTGALVRRLVTYVMYGGQWGLAEGWVAMSIAEVPGEGPGRRISVELPKVVTRTKGAFSRVVAPGVSESDSEVDGFLSGRGGTVQIDVSPHGVAAYDDLDHAERDALRVLAVVRELRRMRGESS